MSKCYECETELTVTCPRCNCTPTPCDELETVRYEYGFAGREGWSNRPYLNGENATVTRELVTRQNAEEVIAAKDVEIERLRNLFKTQSDAHALHVKGLNRQHKQELKIYGDAASALEADNKRLREALEPFADAAEMSLIGGSSPGNYIDAKFFLEARAALGEVKP